MYTSGGEHEHSAKSGASREELDRLLPEAMPFTPDFTLSEGRISTDFPNSAPTLMYLRILEYIVIYDSE